MAAQAAEFADKVSAVEESAVAAAAVAAQKMAELQAQFDAEAARARAEEAEADTTRITEARGEAWDQLETARARLTELRQAWEASQESLRGLRLAAQKGEREGSDLEARLPDPRFQGEVSVCDFWVSFPSPGASANAINGGGSPLIVRTQV